ncbi:hypothetical protein I552_6927 [Mycobacterium xenopi 3993]|nr:hypothetical protein I552_6927 [Mycobacterium xenopi 3993]
MNVVPVTVLVVAKAPVPAGQDPAGRRRGGPSRRRNRRGSAARHPRRRRFRTGSRAVLALAGELDRAAHAAEIRQRIDSFTVIAQRGNSFADRLANAHADAADGYPVLQIGMDTPQVTGELLAACGRCLCETPAVLGLARDGGWWVLGVRTPAMAAVCAGCRCRKPTPVC